MLSTLKEAIAGRTLEELEGVLDWRKVPYAAIYSIEEAVNDPHVQSRGLLQDIEAGRLGGIKAVPFPVNAVAVSYDEYL